MGIIGYDSDAVAPAESPDGAGEADRGRVLERWAEWALGGPLAALLTAAVLVLIGGWLPGYLRWPLWNDTSEFATCAQGWDTGRQLPYRDIICFNFPGQMYLFRAVGRVAGWGNTAAFYALDAGLFVALGAVLVAWGWKRSGRALPGLVGVLALAAFYFDLGYDLVAQRDWQAVEFAVLSLLLTGLWPGWGGRMMSAACLAFALALRPQTVLFWPAAALAVDAAARRPGEPWGRSVVALAGYAVAGAAVVGLALLPLALDGLLPDMVQGIRMTTPGGAYWVSGMHVPTRSIVKEDLLGSPRVLLVPGLLLVLLLAPAPAPWRRASGIWLLAFACVALYRPLSPMNHHEYLRQPLALVWAVCLALLVERALALPGGNPALKVLLVLLAVCIAVERRPRFSTVKNLTTLLTGRQLTDPPSGYVENRFSHAAAHYPWGDYVATVNYLRSLPDPETRVANALFFHPALTAPSGRLTAFPTTALNLPQVIPALSGRYVDSLVANPNSVVVWSPRERDLPAMPSFLQKGVFDQLIPVILRLYEPAARFGDIEVWRRKPSTQTATTLAAPPGRSTEW